MKVEIINKEQVEQLMSIFAETACICYDTDKKYAERVGLSCMREGHMSGSRGNYFLFEIFRIFCILYVALSSSSFSYLRANAL